DAELPELRAARAEDCPTVSERSNDLAADARRDERRVVARLDREGVDRERVGLRRILCDAPVGVLGPPEPEGVPGDDHGFVQGAELLGLLSEARILEPSRHPREVRGERWPDGAGVLGAFPRAAERGALEVGAIAAPAQERGDRDEGEQEDRNDATEGALGR